MVDPTKEQQQSATISLVIVGAGSASIKLAHTLWKQQDLNFRITIVEANDYVGGRVRNTIFEGHRVEMGANWISGRTVAFDNPIWKLAQEIDLQGHDSDRKNPAKIHVVDCTRDIVAEDVDPGITSDGVITDEFLEKVGCFNDVYDSAVSHISGQSGISAANDVSVRSVLESCGWPTKKDLSDIERNVEHQCLEVWITDQLDDLSAAKNMQAGANDMDLGLDEMFVEDSRGFNSIFRGMVNDLTTREGQDPANGNGTVVDIMLEHEVQSICYAPGDIKVTFRDLKTETIKELTADLVVSTVSLGVLQSSFIQFSPPLPSWKVQALSEIKMFNFGKVYVKLPKTLWPVEKYYLALVSKGEESRGHYPFWMRYKSVKRDDNDMESDLMMCYLGGAEARRVEKLSEGEIKDELEELFSKAFLRGNQGQELSRSDCRPVSVRVTDWSRNPRFCGSYSSFPKGAFGTVPIAHLRQPLTGQDNDDAPSPGPSTLYFAGEAFDDTFNGWVQGGYMSGERVANSIIKAYSPSDDGKVHT